MAKKRGRKPNNKKPKPFKYDIYWDSKLELDHYEILMNTDFINVIDRQVEFELFDRFDYINFPNLKKRKYRKMIYTCDFLLDIEGIDKPVVFESKGFARKDYNMRKKLFIRKYNNEYYFWQVMSVKQLKEELEEFKKYIK